MSSPYFVGRESKEESKDQIWYNSWLIQMILIFQPSIVYLLPITHWMNLVQWEKFKSKC